tara:strand:+ start:100 stop:876 length:777 start_codon:yes stop_codon:yes gene_type:complete
MTELEANLIESLKLNNCNVSDAIIEHGCSLKEFQSFLKNEEFLDGYREAERIADDFAKRQFFALVESGDRSATIEYQKMKAKEVGEGELKRIRREVMSIYIDVLDTKADCVRKFCQVFNDTSSKAADFYKKILAEENKESPSERLKRKKADSQEEMAALFESGKLSEVEMYKKMLSISMGIVQNSEYPKEKTAGMDKIIQITQRLDEVEERERRKMERDKHPKHVVLDAIMTGYSEAEVQVYLNSILSNENLVESCEI